MTTRYTLLPAEATILARFDQSDVIATGPWARGYGSVPHRAVIRDLGDELVVHDQIIGDSGKVYYHEGDYFFKESLESGTFLENILVTFDRRIRRHHHLPILRGNKP